MGESGLKRGVLQDFAIRHLDAIIVCTILVGMAIAAIGSLDALDRFTLGVGVVVHWVLIDGYSTTREIIFVFLALVVVLPVIWWTLKLKQKPLWLILVSLVPLGWIGFLFLKHHWQTNTWGLSRWKGLRQFLCWIGAMGLILWICLARAVDLPMTDTVDEISLDQDTGQTIVIKVPVEDYSNAPLWVTLAGKHFIYLLVPFGFLFYGAFQRNREVSSYKEIAALSSEKRIG